MSNQKPLQRVAGTFQRLDDAQAAQALLKNSGISASQLSIDVQSTDPHPALKDTKARESTIGGSVAGGTFGLIVGWTFILFRETLPDVSISMPNAPIAIVLLPALAGAVGGGVIAALAGRNVPKSATSDRRSLANNYLLMVEGTETELQQAADVLAQQ